MATKNALRGKFNSSAYDKEIKERLKGIIDKKPLKNISKFIKTEIDNLTTITSFNYTFKCFPEDGAYAIFRAIQEIEGYSQQQGEKSMSGDEPPRTIDVRFADGSRIKVPWGKIALPSLGSESFIDMGYHKESRQLTVNGQCEKRYVVFMDEIMERAQEILDTDSIYRGKAIKLDSNLKPTFIDLSKIQKIPMHLSDAQTFALQPIVSRIEKSEECLARGLELKFGALMEGEYGTGKTLLAFKLAHKAITNDWGFIYLTDPKQTTEMLDIAGRLCGNGKGVLTFVEDIDQVLRGTRDNKMNEILNIIDGGDTKGRNIISVFTTNHLELIDPTFLRGKRIGSLISMTALDKKTALDFINSHLGDALIDDATEAAEKVADKGIVPAFLAEILDRVKANMVYTQSTTTTCGEIIASIDSYEAQMKLAKTKRQDETEQDSAVRLYKDVFVKDAMRDLLIESGVID